MTPIETINAINEVLRTPLRFAYRAEDLIQRLEDEKPSESLKTQKRAEPVEVFIVQNATHFVIVSYDDTWHADDAHRYAQSSGVSYGRIRHATFTEDAGDWTYYKKYDRKIDAAKLRNFKFSGRKFV